MFNVKTAVFHIRQRRYTPLLNIGTFGNSTILGWSSKLPVSRVNYSITEKYSIKKNKRKTLTNENEIAGRGVLEGVHSFWRHRNSTCFVNGQKGEQTWINPWNSNMWRSPRGYFIKEKFKLHLHTFENLYKCTINSSNRYLN